jgi:succinate dehydrogenase/fumarate reductase flavoprotein subunit
MNDDNIAISHDGQDIDISIKWVHTLIIGSGAAGLNAAVQLWMNGVRDILILTEGLDQGTSINTGSDKQTYYKLSLYGKDLDSPRLMAETYYSGGSMHGDLALVEASLSVRAFSNLVNLGVPFPRDQYGQFIGYKTDHDPRQRATSIGPYTSKEMCLALIRQVKMLQIPITENSNVIQLITSDTVENNRILGAVVLTDDLIFEAYGSENVIFAVGGPGGLYESSVYPGMHTGSIGLALMVGAIAQSLPESQFGLASTKFRWNVSGSYMQAIPRFISKSSDGISDEREFLLDYFPSRQEMHSLVFLKGYQWPFDARKIKGGSSIIDILVYIENVKKGRRVFLDYSQNPDGYNYTNLSLEAREYLEKSNAILETPISRLNKMNPGAIELYQTNGINLNKEPLEIAVCAQHNNGGLAGNIWWESVNIKHLFPIGEVNGSHGVYRPGGSALNSGQVGAIRAVEYIVNRYINWTIPKDLFYKQLSRVIIELDAWKQKCQYAKYEWREERKVLQKRMTETGSHIRSSENLKIAVDQAWEQWAKIQNNGCCYAQKHDIIECFKNRHLIFAHAVYLQTILFSVESGVGSRGSSIITSKNGQVIHSYIGNEWLCVPETLEFREKVLETLVTNERIVKCQWVDRRSIPETDAWFETAWADFREGKIYN